jgi:hypothetical protein
LDDGFADQGPIDEATDCARRTIAKPAAVASLAFIWSIFMFGISSKGHADPLRAGTRGKSRN